MMKKIELPLVEPLYSTYHYQGACTAIIENNPTIRNWYLNQVFNLKCYRDFLYGYTSPQLTIVGSSWTECPHFDKRWYNMRFLKGYVHYVIRNLLDEGFYVGYWGVDDYYVKGKSWYHERHFNHDGLICGYNQEDKTYCIYAYDQHWLYQKFWTPQSSFEAGRKAMFRQNEYGTICGLKPMTDRIDFSSAIALNKIEEYLDSSMEKYPEMGEGSVKGIVVHDYIAKYVSMLYDGTIPYDKMDRRVFRMIWEHKKAMLERILLIESELLLDNAVSEAYRVIVREADNLRMLYAAHRMKRRDALLPIVQKKLFILKDCEQKLLKDLLNKT